MVFAMRTFLPITDSDTNSDTESPGTIGFCRIFPRIRFAGPSSPAITYSDTESPGRMKKLVFRLDLDSNQLRRKAMRVLAASYPGVQSVSFDFEAGKLLLVGGIDPVEVVCMLRKKIRFAEILTVGPARRNDTFPTTARITELQEQSENQQEDQTPPRQADSLISQIEGSPLSRPPPPPPPPPLSLPLASKAQSSSSLVSRPSQGTSNQMQAAADHAPELSSPLAPSSSRIFRTESLADMPAQSSIFGGACLAKDMKLMEEEGLGGHDQLYDSAVHLLLSGINGIGKLKRGYDLRAGEQASRLREMEDAAIMLRKQVEELEARVPMADMSESRLMDMLCASEDRHERMKRELALTREKMDEADRRIEYLEAAVSRYQNRIVVAEAEKEKAEERACRASVEGGTTNTPRPSPADPRSTHPPSFVPSPSPRVADVEVSKESALSPELTALQKELVVKVDLHDDRDRSKAMRVVSGFGGIGSLNMNIRDSKLMVTGDFDLVKVLIKLRKSWHAEILSFGPAKENDGKKNEELIKAYQAYYSPPLPYSYYVPDEEDPNCVIC